MDRFVDGSGGSRVRSGVAGSGGAARSGRRRSPRRRWPAVVLPLAVVAAVALSGCTAAGGTSALSSIASSAAGPTTSSAPADDGSSTAAPSTTARSTTSSPAPAPPPPPPPAAVAANPADGAQGVDPLAPLSVTVSGGTLDSVVVTNPVGEQVPVVGTMAADFLSWTTAPPELGYGKTYTITTAAKNVAGVVSRSQTTFTTVVPNNKTAASSFPTDGMTVGVAQPIAIVFDEPIADKAAALAAITVTTTPAQVGGFRWINDQEVRWRPQNFWQPGTTASVVVD